MAPIGWSSLSSIRQSTMVIVRTLVYFEASMRIRIQQSELGAQRMNSNLLGRRSRGDTSCFRRSISRKVRGKKRVGAFSCIAWYYSRFAVAWSECLSEQALLLINLQRCPNLHCWFLWYLSMDFLMAERKNIINSVSLLVELGRNQGLLLAILIYRELMDETMVEN